MKKIAIMFVGQIRTNGLSKNYSEDNKILDSINNFLLNDNFKSLYDYDIFISTDEIDIEKTKLYFGEHLKNVNITENNWYYNDLTVEVQSYDYFYNMYLKRIQHFSYNSSIGSFYQNYRIYCSYKMILDNEKKTNTNYDYYIKIRLDSRIMQDIMQLILLIDEKQKKICMEHDHLIIVNSEYKEIFNFINFIGSYQHKIDNSDGLLNYFFRDTFYDTNSNFMLFNNDVYFFCPERQIIEYIRYLINKNNNIVKDIFLGITYPSFELVYRGNNSYGYSDYSNDKIFEPYHSIEYIKHNC